MDTLGVVVIVAVGNDVAALGMVVLEVSRKRRRADPCGVEGDELYRR